MAAPAAAGMPAPAPPPAELTPPHPGGVVASGTDQTALIALSAPSAPAPPVALSAPVAPCAPSIARLTRRPDFLACARAPALARGAVLVQMRARADGAPLVRAGFTATKKIGGAVVRNRAKRRLREAARALLPALARPGCDYVFIARAGTPTRPWLELLDDVRGALSGLAADRGRINDRPLRSRGKSASQRSDTKGPPRGALPRDPAPDLT